MENIEKGGSTEYHRDLNDAFDRLKTIKSSSLRMVAEEAMQKSGYSPEGVGEAMEDVALAELIAEHFPSVEAIESLEKIRLAEDPHWQEIPEEVREKLAEKLHNNLTGIAYFRPVHWARCVVEAKK